MSTGLRRRTRCQACKKSCQVVPLEVMVRGGTGWRGYWHWWTCTLCPPCQRGLFDELGRPMLQTEENWPDQGVIGGASKDGDRRGVALSAG